MGNLWLKITAIAVLITFLAASFVPVNSLINHTSSNNILSGSMTIDQSSSSDPSVHLYVNGNGYVIFSANYTVCCISFNYDNDKTQNFTSNDVPSGTIFHLVSSPNSGYFFQKWTGSVNSTSNSINITVNQNINEEAVYQKISTFSVNFTEDGLPAGNKWFVNITGLQSSGPIAQNSYDVSLLNGTYTFLVASANLDYAPNPYSNSFTVSGSPVSVPEITFNLETYSLKFTESGLPEGAWYVNLSNGDQGNALAGSPITFSLPNESYSYTISTSNKLYHSSSYAGTVDVIGNTPVSIVFVQTTYTAQFTETGLPSGQSWYVNITESNGTIYHSGLISSTSHSFSLTNGSYSYTIASANKIYAPNLASGSFTVNGSILSKSILFSEVLYTVLFSESGLPSGASWYVNITERNGTTYLSGPISGSSYLFSLTNGSYTYTIASANRIYSPSIISSSLTVNGNPYTESIAFSLVKYTVTFTESGLLFGTGWYVNLTNGIDSGPITGSSYSFSLVNGSYSYTIQTVNKIYSPASSSGSFTVNGTPLSKSIAFSMVTYALTFKETGLPPGVVWYVNGSGISEYETSPANITFNLSNGTYSFTVTNMSGYYTTTPHFTVIISGKNVTEVVDYYRWAYISGTISPTNADLIINGKSVALTSSGSFNMSVPNGTYHVVISSSGYISYSSNFTLNSGNDMNLTISLKQESHPSTLTDIDLHIVVVGAVIAVIAIGAAVVLIKRRK